MLDAGDEDDDDMSAENQLLDDDDEDADSDKRSNETDNKTVKTMRSSQPKTTISYSNTQSSKLQKSSNKTSCSGGHSGGRESSGETIIEQEAI